MTLKQNYNFILFLGPPDEGGADDPAEA